MTTAWSPVDLLPALWFGVLALLSLGVLRRWYDAVPAAVAAAFFAVLVPLFGGVLAGGGILLPLDGLRGEAPFRQLLPTEPHGNPIQGDLVQLVTPSLAAVRQAYGAGRWPLWNPRAGAGMPLLADPQAQAAAPLALLAAPLPVGRAAGVTAALRVWLALVFAFLLLRRQGCGAGPALAGALSYGLGGFILLWMGWPLANSAAWLPVLLYSVVRCDEVGGRRDFVLLAVAGFGLLTAGHPETLVYGFACGCVFFLDRVRRRPAGTRRAFAAGVAFALLAAGAVAAPVLLPTLDYLPQTLRASRWGKVEPIRGEGLAARLVPFGAPNAYGNSRFIDYWGRFNTNEDASGFAGTAILLLVLLALPGGVAGRRLPQEGLMLALAGMALLILARPPTATPLRLAFVVQLGFAYAGACTLERWRRSEGGEGRRVALAVAGLALAAFLVWAYLAHPDPADPSRLAVLRFGWLRWQLRFLVAAALLLFCARRRRWMPAGIAALLACELVLLHRPANPPSPRRLLFPMNPALQFLHDHLEPERMARMAALGRALPPNLASLYGLADARVYNPMTPRRYVEATAAVTTGFRGEVPEWGHPGDPLYRRLGVRYLLLDPESACPPPLATAFAGREATICAVAEPRAAVFLPAGPLLHPVSAEEAHVAVPLPPEPAGTLLATSIFQDGGWRLLVDGRAVPALPEPAGDPFVAARLPAAPGRADLLYRPRGLLAGCLLAGLGLAFAAARWCPPPGKPVE